MYEFVNFNLVQHELHNYVEFSTLQVWNLSNKIHPFWKFTMIDCIKLLEVVYFFTHIKTFDAQAYFHNFSKLRSATDKTLTDARNKFLNIRKKCSRKILDKWDVLFSKFYYHFQKLSFFYIENLMMGRKRNLVSMKIIQSLNWFMTWLKILFKIKAIIWGYVNNREECQIQSLSGKWTSDLEMSSA